MSVQSINGDSSISSNVGDFDPSKIQRSSGSFDTKALGAINSLMKGMSSFGEAQQYSGQATALDYQADMLGLQSEQLLVSSDYVAKRMEAQGKKVSGSQIAAYAKSGVTFSGSPLLVYAESEKNIRLDILTSRLNYVKEANRLGFEGLQSKIAAGQSRTRSIQKYGEGVLNIGTGLISAGVI